MHRQFMTAATSLVLMMAVPASGQQDRPAVSGAGQLVSGLRLESALLKQSWNLWTAFPTSAGPKNDGQVVTDISTVLCDSTSQDDRTQRGRPTPPAPSFGLGPEKEASLLRKHRTRLDSLFRSMDGIGVGTPLFFYDAGWIPVRVARKDDKPCLLLCGYALSEVYNTLHTTPSSRAAKVLTSVGTLLVSDLYNHFSGSGFDYLGMVMVYGSRDFLSEDSDEKPEVVCLVTSMTSARSFASAEITETDFLTKADVYLSGRDMTEQIKKIEVKTE